MQFLYPRSRQFPFDEVCEQIVRACEAHAWKLPGFHVEFASYGSGAQKLCYVSSIKSDQSALGLGEHDVAITFGRPQGLLPGGRWNDVAAVGEVRVGKRALHVYQDGSGPTLDIYVGDNWEADRATWWNCPNAQLHDKPRRCVRYSGRNGEGALVWARDGREYGPEGAEPRSLATHEVMEDMRGYLRSVILPAIEVHPVSEARVDVCSDPPSVPMPVGVGPFFTYGQGRDAARIETGKQNLGDLELADQYGLDGGGRRLAPLGIKRGPDLPEVAFDGFLWCGTSPTVPGDHGSWSADVLIKVTPRDARGIYVADHAAYEKRRAKLSAAIKGKRDHFIDEEVNDFIRVRACTIVSILDYKGDYEDPVYLINRELGFDEVEVIGRRPS